MKLLTLEQTPNRFGGTVFRTNPLGPIVWLILVGMLTTAWVVAWRQGGLPLWALIPIEVLMTLFLLMAFKMVVRSFTSTNWLMVFAPEQVLLKFRSYLNAHMSPGDLQTISLALDEIRSIRKTRRKETTIGMRNRKTLSFYTFLDVAFNNPVPPQIVDAIAAERRAKHVRKTWYGSTSGKFGDYPVSVLDPNTLRITFNSIRPSIKHALQWFRWQGIEEAPLNKESVDFTRGLADKARTDEKILHLASSGKTIDAVGLARRACNMSLTEAKKFVDELIR